MHNNRSKMRYQHRASTPKYDENIETPEKSVDDPRH
jgi:hypothetical protein